MPGKNAASQIENRESRSRYLPHKSHTDPSAANVITINQQALW